MKQALVVNTNRIIAALIRNSVSRQLLYHSDIDFLGINFSRKEIEKYRQEIIQKAKITEEEFEFTLNGVIGTITFIEDELIDLHIEEAGEIMDKIDPDDTPFIAAALATGADIWSDDHHFQMQKRIKAWKTADLMKFWNPLKR